MIARDLSASGRGPQAQAARDRVLSEFRWQDGHADVWRLFADSRTLALVIDGLAEPWRGHGVTHIVGVESRGFLLGGAVAVRLGAGFHAIRKPGGMLPGRTVTVQSATDYRGRQHHLRTQATLGPNDIVLLVDDWAERGSQACGARALVEGCGARFVGAALVVDQLDDDRVRQDLVRVTSLVRAQDLGDAAAGPLSTT